MFHPVRTLSHQDTPFAAARLPRLAAVLACASSLFACGELTQDDIDLLEIEAAQGAIASNSVGILAGGLGGRGYNEGTGTDVRFAMPTGVVSDTAGTVYVTDAGNNIIRRRASTGAVSLFAGAPEQCGATDGALLVARFCVPGAIARDAAGNLYVGDSAGTSIRKIAMPSGTVTTVAGASMQVGAVDGVGSAARFANITGLVVDGTSLFVADAGNNAIRRVNLTTLQVSTFTGLAGVSATQDGSASLARFRTPTGLAVHNGNLYVADADAHTIRRVSLTTGVVTTVAGQDLSGAHVNGPQGVSRLLSPTGLVVVNNTLLISSRSHTVRKMGLAGTSTNVVGDFAGQTSFGAVDGPAAAAMFNTPNGMTVVGTNVFVADVNNNVLRSIALSTGAVTTASGRKPMAGWVDAVATSARFLSPSHVAYDGSSNVYVADQGNAVRKVALSNGATSTLQSASGAPFVFSVVNGLVVYGGQLYVAENNRVTRIDLTSSASATFYTAPTGCFLTAAGGHGNRIVVGVWCANNTGSLVSLPTPFASGSAATMPISAPAYAIAGDGTRLFFSDGTFAVRERLASGQTVSIANVLTYGLALDGQGNLFATELYGHTVRKISLSTGAVTLVAGDPTRAIVVPGTVATAKLNSPFGIAFTSMGVVFADRHENNVLAIPQ